MNWKIKNRIESKPVSKKRKERREKG